MPDPLVDHIQFEKTLQELLKRAGYVILKTAINDKDRQFRPDFIVKKDDQTMIIELKVQDIITEKPLFQILYYKDNTGIKDAFLAIPERVKINEKIQSKLLSHNIGIIRIKDTDLEIIKPQKDKVLSDKDEERLEETIDDNELLKEVSQANDNLEDLYHNFFLYILLGGLLTYTITKLLEYYVTQIVGIWIAFIVVAIVSVSYLLYVKRKQQD